ncbi:hypothetical protein BGW38_010564 [Lunasporangiospora selenospora]|uniref:Uncharacterized protein n=1 Tax=Lunasporangiospora selenospora TaxID=979761 RepID=A0A9P6FYD4_9FUNG|nr:hypothetical protein BGW38_010564 [Lunasporangiospora selenospora]
MSFESLDRLLVGSVQTACSNLTLHINQCFESDVHAKTFHEFLPRLCEILFGSKESKGWLHLPLSKAEDNYLYELIQPRGVLMRFLLSRYMDSGFIYEIVPDSLPRRTQAKLSPTLYHTLPSIYLSRVNFVKTTTTAGTQKTATQITNVNLNFNMLEYFMFYFAYALILEDDDLNGRGIRRAEPKLPFRINPPHSTASISTNTFNSASGPAPKAPQRRSLLDGPYFNLYYQYLQYFLPAKELPKSGASTSPENEAKKPSPTVFTDPVIEISGDKHQAVLSISEFFVGTIVELWLGQNDSTADNRTIRYVQPGPDVAECISILVSHLYTSDVSLYVLGGDSMPTQISTASGKSTLNLQPFVFDNLLFYTHLLEIYLMRLSNPTLSSRALTSPAPLTLIKELRSVQKVMKAFKAKNLKEVLRVAEQVIVWPENFSESSYSVFEAVSEGGFSSSGTGRRDVTTAFMSNMVSVLATQLCQLEGYTFKYEALFMVEGAGRGNLRMILTKLGNAVDIRQERIRAAETKSKQAAADAQSGWKMISSTLNSVFDSSAPKTKPQETSILTNELKVLRDTMTMVGEVFDLYDHIVKSFERKQQEQDNQGQELTLEQLQALTAPLEETEESSGLLGPMRQRRHIPKGLTKSSVDEVKCTGSRAETLVLSYESEFLVKLTRQAENYLTPKWHETLRRVQRVIPLPPRVLKSKVHLRWLASIPTLTFLLALLGLITSVVLLKSWMSATVSVSNSWEQEHHVARKLVEDTSRKMDRYDAHVQPENVYSWEPDRPNAQAHGKLDRPTRRVRTADPKFTIDVQGI